VKRRVSTRGKREGPKGGTSEKERNSLKTRKTTKKGGEWEPRDKKHGVIKQAAQGHRKKIGGIRGGGG